MTTKLVASEEALHLVADACFDDEAERKLFLDDYRAVQSHAAPDLRHIDRGYQQEIISALKHAADWALSIAASVPGDIAKDAIKLWIYTEALKRINGSQYPESARAIFDRIKSYLEKKVK